MTVATKESKERAGQTIEVPGAPDIPGLRFRHFSGPADYPHFVRIINEAYELDNIEEVSTVENMTGAYANLRNSDPYRDVLVVEIGGEPAGYSRVEWWLEQDGNYIYNHFYSLAAVGRDKGLEEVITRYNEALLRERAQEMEHNSHAKPQYYETYALDHQKYKVGAVLAAGYEPVRYDYAMVRPDLENIPDIPIPEGLEVRPVTPDQFRAIYDAEREAFKDHWGMDEADEGDFDRWQHGWPLTFQPHLWQVAWDKEQNEVAGMVRNFIVEEANLKYGRKRGYTEFISVRRPWRKRGLAKALIAASFKVLKDQGMTEAALGVDTQNPSGALQLYESMGFQVDKSGTVYRKRWV
jgi:mycothiol synthase